MVILNLSLIALLGYLAGSIPTSVWLSKYRFGFDIRERGSGNAGATNAWRVLGWKAALIVVLVDIGKGFAATAFLADIRLPGVDIDPVYTALAAGVAAVMGHVWTLFAGFRGGKGVATLGGMLIALYPTVIPLSLGIFVIVVVATRYVSLGSLAAAISLPVSLAVLHWGLERKVPEVLFFLALAMCAFILYTHRSNIKRLLRGTENKLGAPKSSQTNLVADTKGSNHQSDR